MARMIVVFGCLLIFFILLPLQATSGREDVGQLTQQLLSTPVTGKPASSLIINKNFAGTDQDRSINATALKDLAQAVGFVDDKGEVAEAVLTNSGKTNEEFKEKLNQWQAQGRLTQARAVEEVNPVSLLEKLLSEAQSIHQNDHAGFVAFLKSMDVQPESVKLASLNAVKLPSGNEKGPLHYFAQRFYLEKALQALKERSTEVQKLNGKLIYGGPYPGSIGAARNWDAIMLQAWRMSAFTAPWVADLSWQNGEFSPQATGYYLALARAAQTNSPIFCDLHVGKGNNPVAIRRSFYQALAHGAKAIRFVGATPCNLGTDGEWLPTAQTDSWKTIRQLTHEAGQHEGFFLETKPRPSQIGLVVSLTAELWDPSLWVHEERKAIYHAARLSGHNIRILTEEDVQKGPPLDLSTIYFVGTHLQKRTAQVLTDWVKTNKSLGLVGGPLRDEYDQPLTDLHQLMGVTQASWENKQEAGAAKITLAQLKPFDNIHWSYEGLQRDIPVVYGKLSMTIDQKQAADLDVYGRFANKSPAIVRHVLPNSKTHIWTFGAPIGSGWFKEAFNKLNNPKWVREQSPNSFNHQLMIRQVDGEMGDIVMSASGESRWDVITDNLSVESILLESPKSMGMVCINWSGQPQKAFLTAQFLPAKYQGAKSMTQGQLKTTRAGVTLSFKTTVEVTDLITFEP